MNRLLIPALFFLLLVPSCSRDEQEQHKNPFLSEYDTPFQVPPFDKIATSDFLPAVEKGIAEQQAEIDAVANNPASPTFENTILAFNNSGRLLAKVMNVFECLIASNTNSAMQALAGTIFPLVTAHQDNIYLNDTFFRRMKAVYEDRDNGKLDAEQKRVTEKYYNDFVRSGANLGAADKITLRDINRKLSTLMLTFEDNVLAETNENFKLVIEKKEDLDGLPQAVVDAAAEAGTQSAMEGKWVFTLQGPSIFPFLQYAKNRALRGTTSTSGLGYLMRMHSKVSLSPGISTTGILPRNSGNIFSQKAEPTKA
jgi:peptidyl-dipeptidase Dcp